MWGEANGNSGPEVEDLIMVEVEAKWLSMEKIRLTSMTNALMYGKHLKSSRTGR